MLNDSKTQPPALIRRRSMLLASGACMLTVIHPPALLSQQQPPASRFSRQWQPLFDGQQLGAWESTNFGGEGEVTVHDGAIDLGYGTSMTGVTFTGEVPRMNYEIKLEAQRVEGIDFFCGLTFPVKQSYCSFIVGGWAGAVVGLSSIDGKDASENDTTRYMNFDTGRWYKIRLRVSDRAIQAWIDGKRIINQNIVGRTISVRNEVELSQPLGFSTWETRAMLRDIQIRPLRVHAPRRGRERVE